MSRIRNEKEVVGIGTVDKQNGGNGQFARVEVAIRPLESTDTPNQIENDVVGGTIPTEFISSVLNGVQNGLNQGPLGGFSVSGVAVRITGGKSHAVDSTTQAFQEAGRFAVQDALRQSEAALLEPVATLDVMTPADFVGTVVGDINRRRGKILALETRADGSAAITASVPLAETFGYATALRSMTQGRAGFSLQPTGYEEAPLSVAQEIAHSHSSVRRSA